MSDECSAYLRAGLAEMQRALSDGRDVWGWQFGAKMSMASVELAPPTEQQWAYLGSGKGGRQMYFTVFGIEGKALSEDAGEDAALRWLEGIAYGSQPRGVRNHALRLLCMLPKRSRRETVSV